MQIIELNIMKYFVNTKQSITENQIVRICSYILEQPFDKEACEILSNVGLCAKEYIDREVNSSLSGGELKRIELAMALAKGGEVFLFDEPEAGIDLWSFDELVNIFKKLEGKTVIIVSHQNKILEVADNILLLKNGEYQMGTREEMLCNIDSTKCSRLSEVAHE